MFIVGYNMVGYLPESEPYAFNNWEDARRSLIEEMNFHADNLDSWVEGDCDDDIPCGVHGEDCKHDQANSLSLEAEDLNLSNGPGWSTVIGIMSYWIVEQEGSADEYNGLGVPCED